MANSLVAEGLSCSLSLQAVRYHAKQQKLTHMPCLGRHLINGHSLANKKHHPVQRRCISAVQNSETPVSRSSPPSRRELLQLLAGLAIAGAAGPCCQTATAEEASSSEFLKYTDPEGKFGLSIPGDWAQGEGRASSQRRVVAFFKEGDTDTNVNIVITPLSADYTKMGSFGSAEAFGETLVNGLDRSWTKPKGPVAKLLDAKAKNGRYFVEYTFQAPGQMKRHLMSSVGMGFDGTYNRLYTVTAQAREEEFAQYAGTLNKVLSSFELKFKSPTY